MAPNRLCLITALAPVPAFLGGSCPLGCSLSAPAAGGCSVVSLQWSMYAAGSEKEKRAGCPLHGGTIAQLFVFCKGGVAGAPDSGGRTSMGTDGLGLACALLQRGDWLGVRRCPTGPPSNVFGNRGTPPVPPAGLRPCTLLGERGFVLACALHQRRVWLGVRRCPTCPPSNVFGYRGTPPVPPAGAAPPAPCLGTAAAFARPARRDASWLANGRGGGDGSLPSLLRWAILSTTAIVRRLTAQHGPDIAPATSSTGRDD